MIVQCDKCRTKFRIADEKVTDAGVKVRCSRCAHVFMVRRGDLANSTPLPVAPNAELERALRDAGLQGSTAMPSFPPAGVPTVRMGGSSLVLQPPQPQSAMPAPAQASGLPLGPSLNRIDMGTYAPVAPTMTGFSSSPPEQYPVPSMVPEQRSSADTMIALGFASPPTFDTPDESETIVAEIPKRAPNEKLLAKHLAFEDDPTASYSAYTPLTKQMPIDARGDPGPAVTAASLASPVNPGSTAGGGFDDLLTRRYPLPPFGTQNGPGSDPMTPITADAQPPADNGGELDLSTFGGMEGFSSPPAPAPQPPKPATNPNAQAMFGKPATNPAAMFGKPATNPAASFGKPATNPAAMFGKPATNPNAIPNIAKPPTNPNASANPGVGASAAVSSAFEPRFPAAAEPPTNPFFPPPPDLAALIAAAGPSLSGPSEVAHQSGDIPGLLAPGATSDDPFAGLDLEAGGGAGAFTGNDPSSIPSTATPFDDEKDRSTFSLAKQQADAQAAQPLARIDLGRNGPTGNFGSNLATTRVSTALPLPARERDTTRLADYNNLGRGLGRWPTYVGLAVGLAITVAAVIGPAGGDLSKLGPGDIAALFSPPLTQPLEEGLGAVRARRAHVTTYPTRAGRRLLVVAGEALNEGGETLTDVEAVAMVLEGQGVVDKRNAPIGVLLAEDALVAVATPKDLEAAYAAAEKNLPRAPGDTALRPGSTLPFMVVFPDAPSDLEHRTFQVEFRRANRQPSARSP